MQSKTTNNDKIFPGNSITKLSLIQKGPFGMTGGVLGYCREKNKINSVAILSNLAKVLQPNFFYFFHDNYTPCTVIPQGPFWISDKALVHQ